MKTGKKTDQSDPDFTGLRHVVNRAFKDIDLQMDFIAKSLLLQWINGILTRRTAFDRPDWCWHVIGPAPDWYWHVIGPAPDLKPDSPDKISAQFRAMWVQREFHLSCMSATTGDDLLRSCGILIETPCSSHDVLLTGFAGGRDIDVVGIGNDSDEIFMELDIPFHVDAHEAFKDLVTRSATGMSDDDIENDPDEVDEADETDEAGSNLPPALSLDAERAA